MAMLMHRLRRVLVAAPSYFQRSFTLSRPSDFTPVSSLFPRRSVVKVSQSSELLIIQHENTPTSSGDCKGDSFAAWTSTTNSKPEQPVPALPSRNRSQEDNHSRNSRVSEKTIFKYGEAKGKHGGEKGK
ncbi:hypothetical protein CARUB_v10028481mg [Capsella rubella]|uniref:Uncharacterized protein n=1 Tax=Capsella rubella TaxID=81985 RepID=R0EUG6_9BRAS|nr:hypothetical protein CARUB_v10028481mg [Capsella rubella]